MEANRKVEIKNNDECILTPFKITEMINALRETQQKTEDIATFNKNISESVLRKKYGV